ncbi:hypothetical protein CRE_21390 [Caenorhabditis remanei]|uniref:Protein kinase domain-containing protein n=1 Tax=Caenorhabditis remanei TaxID=31234 RepID=E3MUP6_CAERE|nr:hypothetical protein CRE_21390 [Caenorhabditis remanei]
MPPTSATARPDQSLLPYKMVRKIGSGSFGEVYLMEDRVNPDIKVAAKMISKSKRMKAHKEFLIHKELSDVGHENVIRILEMRKSPDFSYLYLEYAECGDLFDRIPMNSSMRPPMARKYFKQLITGLKFIHGQGVVHRDIKPENLLIGYGDILKICDFGHATKYLQTGIEVLLAPEVGTVEYAAPENYGPVHRGPPLDVWSAGVTLMTMVVGEYLWKKADVDCREYRKWIAGKNLTKNNPFRRMNSVLFKLLRQILTDDVDQRLTLDEIENNPWVRLNKDVEYDVITIE